MSLMAAVVAPAGWRLLMADWCGRTGARARRVWGSGARAAAHWQSVENGSALLEARKSQSVWLRASGIAHLGVLRAAEDVDAKRLVTPAPRAPQRKREQILRPRDGAARLVRLAFVKDRRGRQDGAGLLTRHEQQPLEGRIPPCGPAVDGRRLPPLAMHTVRLDRRVPCRIRPGESDEVVGAPGGSLGRRLP